MKAWPTMWRVLALFALNLPLAASAQPSERSQERQQEQVQRQTTQPGNNAPFWREVREGDKGYSSLPGKEQGVLIQSAGQSWRELRNGPLTVYGGIALAVVFVIILIFYRLRGPIELEGQPTGRRVRRFSPWERLVHWSTAISFVLLAFTGLALLFGKHLLVPILGHNIFSFIAIGAKVVHNFVGPLFIICAVLLFATFVRYNLWTREDWQWVRCFGGLLSRKGHAPPSRRFNAGEKAWFWGGLSFLGLVAGLSGLVLDFPNFDQTRRTMQIAHIIHLGGALLFMIGALGHIYMGTIGTRGAFKAMKTGYVDEQWVKEHHALWYDDYRNGRIEQPQRRTNDSVNANLEGNT
ncbi:MAG TPA: formate dehydrogenase subunit gamma [Burkholderiales bacterium]|nr:formate dehydrogenase subunit gamma [Burkholderiales bacterium]